MEKTGLVAKNMSPLKKGARVLLALSVFGAIVGGIRWYSDHKQAAPVHQAAAKGAHGGAVENERPKIWARLFNEFKDIPNKIEEVATADQENYRLRLENSKLRQWAEELRFSCAQADGEAITRRIEMQLTKETGARVGRTLQSIAYRPPSHLGPPQLYALGLHYLKAKDFEKAAVIFTYLTGLQDTDQYKTPKNYLVTGMVWYQLDHYKLANTYFDEVLKGPDSGPLLRLKSQSRLWKALAFDRMEDPVAAQVALKELVDRHPRSRETAWINSGTKIQDRQISSHEEEDTSPIEKHEGAQPPEHGEAKSEHRLPAQEGEPPAAHEEVKEEKHEAPAHH